MENKAALSIDRADGVIVSLLPEFLLQGEDIHTNLAMSGKLYYQLTNMLIPALVDRADGRYTAISIHCPLCIENMEKRDDKVSATGMSFGIDSLYSYYSHRSPDRCDSAHRVNLVTFLNHGSLNGQYTKNDAQMRELFMKGKEKVKRFAKSEGISYLTVDSNINALYTRNYTETHTFRTAGLMLMFQSKIQNYYYASGVGLEDFHVSPFDDSAHYDVLSLPLLSTENMQFYSDGLGVSRYQKTEFLNQFENVRKCLSVCWKELDNCSMCPKCIRTMAALEIMGELASYGDVFNLESYDRNHTWNWAKIISLRKTDEFYREIYEQAMKKGFHITLVERLLAICFAVSRRVVNPQVLHKTINEQIPKNAQKSPCHSEKAY